MAQTVWVVTEEFEDGSGETRVFASEAGALNMVAQTIRTSLEEDYDPNDDQDVEVVQEINRLLDVASTPEALTAWLNDQVERESDRWMGLWKREVEE